MIKISATQVSLPAIAAAIADGININVTLIFSRQRYAEAMEAYLQGLERRWAAGLSLDRVASVAPFFVSRVHSKVDGHLAALIAGGGEHAAQAQRLLGKAAVANAKLAYADYQAVFGGERFLRLQASGAAVQRPLWASTSTREPRLSGVDVCGPVDWAGHGEHRAAADAGRVVGPWRGAARNGGRGPAGRGAGAGRVGVVGHRHARCDPEVEDEGVASFAHVYHEVVARMEAHRQAAA